MRRKREPQVPGSCPRLEVPPAVAGGLSKVLWGPPGVQERWAPVPGPCFPPSSPACRSRLLPCCRAGSRAAAREVGVPPSAFVFLVYLFIQLLGLKVLQTVCPATHDFIRGLHEPEQKPLSWLLPDNV